MKKFKRVLAMSLALALLLSFSPALGVSAADADNTAYSQLMQGYEVFASSDFSALNENLVISKNDASISVDTDNEYLKFDKTPKSKRADLKASSEELKGTIIFEMDVCWTTAGMQINVYNLGDSDGDSRKNFITFTNKGRVVFNSPDGNIQTSYNLKAGKWHTITYVFDVDNGKYDAFVDKELIASDRTVPAGYVGFTGFRLQTANASETDFLVDNVKFYKPCADENKDHACDTPGCSNTLGACEDTNNDGVCDYGCGKSFSQEEIYHEYKIENGAIIDENGNAVTDNEIKESGVLDMYGQNATIEVTGENTKLSVVDTSWMTNGLSGEKAAKLTVTKGADKIETYTQYGDFKYLKVPGEDDTYTFHPFNLTITRMGLNTVMEAISLEVQFVADNVVRDLLIGENEEHTYGLKNLTTGEFRFVKENSAYQFTTQNNRAVAYFALSGSLHNDNFDKEGKFQAYMKVKIGDEEVEILSNYIADITPRKVMTDLNNSNVEASADQIARIQAIWTNEDGTDNADYSELKSVLARFH